MLGNINKTIMNKTFGIKGFFWYVLFIIDTSNTFLTQNHMDDFPRKLGQLNSFFLCVSHVFSFEMEKIVTKTSYRQLESSVVWFNFYVSFFYEHVAIKG